ncbi:MAG: outer membrane beta-barrel protein [Cytophagales bacterium]|nr:outer membrane beta-barrel protein [Cytophagales bacterium]
MKHIITIISSLLLISTLQAQLSSGTIAVGGAFGIQLGSSSAKSGTVSADGPSSFNFIILPSGQYFISPQIGIGMQLGYGVSSTSQKSAGSNPIESGTSSSQLVISPYARYYKSLSEEGRFYFFAQGAFGLTLESGSTKSGNITTDQPGSTTITVGFSPGIMFFPAKKIGLDATLGNVLAFRSKSTTQKASGSIPESSTSQTTIDLFNVNSLGFTFGLHYFFGK